MSEALDLSTLTTILECFNLPALLVDYETRRILAVNEAFIAESGYTVEQLVGQPTEWFSIIPFADSRDSIYARLAEEGQVSTRIFGRDSKGGVGEILARLRLIKVGGRRLVLITSEHSLGIGTELQPVGHLLQAILEVLPGVVYQYTYDPSGKGRLSYMSGKAETLFGFSAEALIADEMRYWRQVPYEYRLAAKRAFDSANANKTAWEVEHPFIHAATGEERWLRFVAFPKTTDDGSVHWTGFASDVTEMRQLRDSQSKIQSLLEEERLRKSKLESLGTLAGGIAHDFNNLLAVLTGNLSLIKRDPSLSAENQRRLEAIERATERAKLLAKQLLTFAKGGDPVLETLSLEAVVVETMRDVFEARGVEAVFEAEAHLWLTRGDKGQLMQVFQNLAVNAADAMPSGGRVQVGFRNRTLTEHDARGLPPGDYVCVSVTDTGCGIAPEHLSRIFDPYFTTKSGGHGLGLAVGYSIVAKHGGQIRVTSTVGVGTRFDVYLPAKKTSEITLESSPLTEAETARILQRRLLVMDDDDLMRDLLGTALETFGYGVVTCRRGEEAVERYRAAMETGQAFLGVILDLRIAGGMGGKETLAQLQALDSDVTAIVCSGYHEDSVMADHRAYGFAAKLPKPFDIDELGRVLDRLFGASEAP